MLVHRPLSVLPFVALAYSGPLVGRNPQCSTGSPQCCQSVQSANSPMASMLSLMGLLDGVLPLDGNSQIGLQCSSLTGAGSTVKCTASTVCCNNTQMNGLVNLGCSPVEL